MICPFCKQPAEREVVDIGVGEMPTGPWGCWDCLAFVDDAGIWRRTSGFDTDAPKDPER